MIGLSVKLIRPMAMASAHSSWARRVIGLAVVLAALLGGGTAAQAAGYWRCSNGVWTAIGDPRHPMPARSCGARPQLPGDQTACVTAGGRWGPVGIFPRPICRMPTSDGGRLCADDGECEGHCLAALNQEQRARVKKRHKLPMTGTCTPVVPVFGCMAIVREGVVSGFVCRD